MIATTDKPQQLSFPSLAFDRDRTVLTVGEVADRWRVTDQHIIDLLEEGKLDGFDISGRHEFLRLPATAVEALALRFSVPRETILEIIRSARPGRRTARAHWRVPREGYEGFIRENHSRFKI